MLDKVLPNLLDSACLGRRRDHLRRRLSAPSSLPQPLRAPTASPLPMTSLFDQSSLTKIAERLVEAARRHGADAADAVAVRGISQSIDVRDGSVEESQRSEGANVALRPFLRPPQAVDSTNDPSAHVTPIVY